LEGEGWGGRGSDTKTVATNRGDTNPNPNRGDTNPNSNPNRFRLERFGKAMAGTGSWEAPGAVLHGVYFTCLSSYS
jgi:hypothetical protein